MPAGRDVDPAMTEMNIEPQIRKLGPVVNEYPRRPKVDVDKCALEIEEFLVGLGAPQQLCFSTFLIDFSLIRSTVPTRQSTFVHTSRPAFEPVVRRMHWKLAIHVNWPHGWN
jgi:hypothetical protein